LLFIVHDLIILSTNNISENPIITSLSLVGPPARRLLLVARRLLPESLPGSGPRNLCRPDTDHPSSDTTGRDRPTKLELHRRPG